METFSPLLAFCGTNSPVNSLRPVARSFDVFFDLRLEQTVEETIGTPVIRDAIALIMTSL